MLGDDRQCKFFGMGCPSSYVLEPLCTDEGGRMPDGKRAQCYKEFSFYYRALNVLTFPLRKIAEFASERFGKGLEHLGGIEDN